MMVDVMIAMVIVFADDIMIPVTNIEEGQSSICTSIQ